MSETYSCNDLLDALLVTFHLQECLDLADCQVFPISKSDQLIKCTEQLVCILHDLSLIQALACACNDLGEEMEGVDVLEDIGLAVRDQDHIEFVEGLVDKSNVVLLHGRMLGTAVGQFWE
jgi:hypothetical protein